MKINKFKKMITASLIFSAVVISFVSCEDDSLPDVGSIPDINLPTGAFSVANSQTSSLVKIFNNTSRSATGGTWIMPLDAGAFVSECDALSQGSNCDSNISGVNDETVYFRFNDFGTYQIAIEATDDNGEISEIIPVDVIIEPSGAPAPTGGFETESELFSDGQLLNNAERIFTNTSVNDDGGISWSVIRDGETVDIISEVIANPRNSDFSGQTSSSESILVDFVTSGIYEVTLTARNFDAVESTVTEIIVVDPDTNPTPSFTYSSSDDYSVQTFVNTTPDSDRVLWSLPDGGTFVNGTAETDQTVSVSFPGSGNYNVSLTVVTESFDENGDPIDLDGETTLALPVVTSISEIDIPFILRGGFEPGIVTNPADSGVGTFRNDLGKEWWPADGLSNRVYKFDTLDGAGGTIEDPTQTILDTGLDNESWFGANSGFNRLNITGNARTGQRAASFDPSRPTRLAVQTIDVVPGVDYKVTFYYANVSNTPNVGLKVYILKETVANETDANVFDNRIAGIVTDGVSATYEEENVTFNSGDNTQVKLYFYPSDPTAATFYVDDVSISID